MWYGVYEYLFFFFRELWLYDSHLSDLGFFRTRKPYFFTPPKAEDFMCDHKRRFHFHCSLFFFSFIFIESFGSAFSFVIIGWFPFFQIIDIDFVIYTQVFILVVEYVREKEDQGRLQRDFFPRFLPFKKKYYNTEDFSIDLCKFALKIGQFCDL